MDVRTRGLGELLEGLETFQISLEVGLNALESLVGVVGIKGVNMRHHLDLILAKVGVLGTHHYCDSL